jgi:hypothetical protein
MEAYVQAPSGAEHEAIIQELSRGKLHDMIWNILSCSLKLTILSDRSSYNMLLFQLFQMNGRERSELSVGH